MSDPEDFLSRWSRRKREAAEDAHKPKSNAQPELAAGRNGAAKHSDRASHDGPGGDAALPLNNAPDATGPAFDLADLPAIDSISAETDIRAFLAPGVPSELTRAALRRVWASDPKIRDFVGPADYAWDFNGPGSMAGFGPLEVTDEIGRQVARLIGRGSDEHSDGATSDPKAADSEPVSSLSVSDGTSPTGTGRHRT